MGGLDDRAMVGERKRNFLDNPRGGMGQMGVVGLEHVKENEYIEADFSYIR
jgi:hypothetical protein